MRSRPLIARALDPKVPSPDDEISERILDATLSLCAESGARHLTMDDVAARAGVGRITVYRRIGDRDKLLEALAIRECRRGLAVLAAAVNEKESLEDRMAEGFVAALRFGREHPLLRRMASLEPQVLIATLAAPKSQVFATMRSFMTAQIRSDQKRGRAAPGDAEEMAELLVRIGISFLLIPESVLPIHDDAGARRVARTLIAPLVKRRR